MNSAVRRITSLAPFPLPAPTPTSINNTQHVWLGEATLDKAQVESSVLLYTTLKEMDLLLLLLLIYIYIFSFFLFSFFSSFRYKRCFRMAVVEQLEYRGWEVLYVKFASIWHCMSYLP